MARNINKKDEEGNTLLHRVLLGRDGVADELRAMIPELAEIKPTTLVDLIKVLVDSGAKINRRNGKGDTPLHIAVAKSSLKTIRSLLDLGAHINSQNREGFTPLHMAVDRNSADLLRMLVTAGADLNLRALSDMYDRPEVTPLQYATILCKIHSFKALVDAGSDLNSVIINGDTLLHLAIFCYNQPRRDDVIEIIDILLSKGVDEHLKNKQGETPLHYAAVHNDRLIIQRLLQAGAEPRSLTNKGKTAFDLCEKNIKEMEKICEKFKKEFDKFDKTPYLECLDLLRIVES